MNIKEIRKMTGLSQAKFAGKYNIPVRTIEDWETEKRTPPAYVIELLKRAVEADNEPVEENFVLSGKQDLGEDFSIEEYKSANYEVTVTANSGVKSVKAVPRCAHLPEVYLCDGQVTRIGFIGNEIYEENLEKSGQALIGTVDLLKKLRKM